jgi:hypothetical protein
MPVAVGEQRVEQSLGRAACHLVTPPIDRVEDRENGVVRRALDPAD